MKKVKTPKSDTTAGANSLPPTLPIAVSIVLIVGGVFLVVSPGMLGRDQSVRQENYHKAMGNRSPVETGAADRG
jgi:hypothetical protein